MRVVGVVRAGGEYYFMETLSVRYDEELWRHEVALAQPYEHVEQMPQT